MHAPLPSTCLKENLVPETFHPKWWEATVPGPDSPTWPRPPGLRDGQACPHSSQGDSGGPLICNGVLQGVDSFVIRACATTHHPDFFARVSLYVDWIRSVLAGAEGTAPQRRHQMEAEVSET